MLDTGVAPTAQDANHAAGAALARGDLHQARERLLLVAQLTENRDVIETLYRIDTEYARVQLSGRAELIAEQRPFQPEAMQAVDFAAAALQDVGGFTGFLPPGRYRYGSEVIELVAGLDTAFNASDDVSKRSSRKKR
jgi:hypothetical protein